MTKLETAQLRIAGHVTGGPEDLAVEITCEHPANRGRAWVEACLKAAGFADAQKRYGTDQVVVHIQGRRLKPIRVADPAALTAFEHEIRKEVAAVFVKAEAEEVAVS